jgi:hypothetical protein
MDASEQQSTVNPDQRFRRPRTPVVIPDRVARRAATAYVVVGECWVSTYSVGSHGYAQIGWDVGEGRRRATTAHRAAWVHFTGAQIPTGMTVDHLCKTRKCVNPAHLRVLTNFENARRTAGRDWPVGECVHGHPNTGLTHRGSKLVCATCSAEWERRYRAKRKAA